MNAITKLRDYEITLRVGLLALLLAGCRLGEETLPTSTTPVTPRPTGQELTVRIGIKIDTAAVFLTAVSPTDILDKDSRAIGRMQANERWTFTTDNTTITGTSAGGQTVSSTGLPVLLRPTGAAFIMIDTLQYRGEVLLRPAGPGRLTAINVLQMENYLLGVVPFEIGRLKAPDIEALKVQAIAARTYAVGNMNGRGALGFDFYATVADQVYRGTSGEDSIITRAILETRGEIVTHNGQPILAYYSSTCGGHTADGHESWPYRAPQPYLRGKPDTDASGEAFCKFSNRFRWNVSWPGDSLRMILQQTLGVRQKNPDFRITRLEDVKLTGKTRSGRAEAVEFLADGVTHRIAADSIRWILRPTATGSLNSSLIFDLRTTRDNGAVTRLDVSGGGWGHAIGMCQVGAIGRARAGQSYRTILAHYYSDTQIQRLY